MSRLKRPSPALVISILALVAAIAVPAYALTKKEKKTVKKLANGQITKRAPGLAVASAKSAANASTLDGQDASDFTSADELHSTGRVVRNDPNPGDNIFDDPLTLFVAGAFTVQAQCALDAQGSGPDVARVVVAGPQGTSFAGVDSSGAIAPQPNSNFPGAVAFAESPGNNVGGGHLTAVAPTGDVVSVQASAEVGDPAGDCIFGVTAIGP